MKIDGTRVKGVIEKRMKLIKINDLKDFLRTIIEQAAAKADDDGRVSDAVTLYHLAEDFNTVYEVLNRNISDWIASEDPMQFSQQSAQYQEKTPETSLYELEDPVELGIYMATMYMGAVNIYRQISVRNREALFVLLKIAEAKKDFLKQEYDKCLTVSFQSTHAVDLEWEHRPIRMSC